MLYVALVVPAVTVGVWMVMEFAGLWPGWTEPMNRGGRSESVSCEGFAPGSATAAPLREKTSHSV
jgi:hypothetical protein